MNIYKPFDNEEDMRSEMTNFIGNLGSHQIPQFLEFLGRLQSTWHSYPEIEVTATEDNNDDI